MRNIVSLTIFLALSVMLALNTSVTIIDTINTYLVVLLTIIFMISFYTTTLILYFICKLMSKKITFWDISTVVLLKAVILGFLLMYVTNIYLNIVLLLISLIIYFSMNLNIERKVKYVLVVYILFEILYSFYKMIHIV